MQKRDKRGRFTKQRGWYVDSKGYPCYSTGELRGRRIHRVEAEKKQGKPLERDQDVHHKDGNKLNWSWDNLIIMGHREHGAVSAKQHHWAKTHDFDLMKEWNDFFDEEEKVAEDVSFEVSSMS